MRYVIVIGLLCTGTGLAAQEDTLYLQQVEVSSRQSGYARGMIVSRPDSVLTMQYEAESLADLLQESSAIYLRKYGGEGQVATISFRGTTPSHTRVNWNGVDINSQTLGQSDFSSIPVFLFSDIELYHGASSALFGSGSIGGTINLKSDLLNRKGFNAGLSQHFGSFGKWFSGIKTSFGTSAWNACFAVFHSRVENDFEVAYRDTTYKQNNAASRLTGVMAGARYRIGPTSDLTLEGWYNDHDRQSQPVIGDFSADDRLADRNLRLNATYSNAMKTGWLQASLSFVDDDQIYNSDSRTHLQRYVSAVDYEYTGLSRWTFRGRAHLSYAVPDVASYATDTTQLRGGVALLSEYRPLKRLMVSLNLRQPFIEGIEAPVVPSLGMEYTCLEKDQNRFVLLVQGARSFRAPTLNDLFWQPGGNPLLKPEDGFSMEGGVSSLLNNGPLKFGAELTAYRSWITDLIQWVPGGQYWYPENTRRVEIAGVEASFSLKGTLSGGDWYIRGGYNYNDSRNRSRLNDLDRSYNKQLAYVPYHKGALAAGYAYKGWKLVYSWSFTGKRFTESTNTTELEAFSLAGIRLRKSWPLGDHRGDHRLSAGLEIDNLWDVTYQNYEMRATPGRNYLISINYQLTKSKL